MMRAGTLMFPAINVNDSVTKSKFDNKYGVRHSLIDGLNRATDVLIMARLRSSAVTATSARAVRNLPRPGRPRDHHRDRPDLRASGSDGRLPGATLEEVLDVGDIYVTATGCRDVITADQMRRMKHQAIVCNIGHFDNEIDIADWRAASTRPRSTSSLR